MLPSLAAAPALLARGDLEETNFVLMICEHNDRDWSEDVVNLSTGDERRRRSARG